MHSIINRNAGKASAHRPNRIIDTGSHTAYLHYAMAVVVGRPRRQIDAVAAKAGATARRHTAKAGTRLQARGTDASGATQGPAGAAGGGNADGGDGDGDGPGRRNPTSRSRRRSPPTLRPTGRYPDSHKIDPNLPHRRGLITLVLLTLILVCTALIFGLNGHGWLATEVMGMAGGLPFLAARLVNPK